MKDIECIFCKIVEGTVPSTKIYEDESVLAFLDVNPVNVGHTLVIPKGHFKNIYETPYEIIANMIKTVKNLSEALKKTGAEGVNVAMNNDTAAGQVVFHSHVHVIPRYVNDGFELWHGKRGYEEGEAQQVAKKISESL